MVYNCTMHEPFDHTDPFSVCLMHRKMAAGVDVWFHKGDPDRAGPGGRVTVLRRAHGTNWPTTPGTVAFVPKVVPGYYSLSYSRENQIRGETLTEGECNRLKLKMLDDGMHVYLPPCA